MKPVLTLSFAVASLALLCPPAMHAQNAEPANSQTDTMVSDTNMGHRTAANMVPAEAALKQDVDAKKLQPGSNFTAVLTQSAKLKDGRELPRGTTLVGKVEQDTSHPGQKSDLTLRFTEAKLKNGQQIPINATIVGVAPPATGEFTDMGAQIMSPWDGRSLAFDQIGAMHGVDLHSRIGASNSGTFVSNKRDVKLANGSQLALAIGSPRNVS